MEKEIVRYSEIPVEERENGSYSIRRIVDEYSAIFGKNIGVYETVIPVGGKVSRHAHAYLEEILIFLTKAKIEVGGEMKDIGKMDIVVLPPLTMHEIYATDEEAQLIALKFPNIKDDKIKG